MRVENFLKREELEILELEKHIGVELVAYERPPVCVSGSCQKWYVQFEHSDIKKGSFLLGISGDGESVNDAIINYCRLISGKTLVIHGMSPTKRVEISIPELKHYKWIVTDDGDILTNTFDKRWEQRYNESISDWLTRNYGGIVRRETWK